MGFSVKVASTATTGCCVLPCQNIASPSSWCVMACATVGLLMTVMRENVRASVHVFLHLVSLNMISLFSDHLQVKHDFSNFRKFSYITFHYLTLAMCVH